MSTELVTRESAPIAPLKSETLSKLVLDGNLAGLTPAQKVDYYLAYCQRVGLDPATKPFDLLRLNGKEVLYATRACAQQLSSLHKVSHTIVDRREVEGCFVVTARAFTPDGRQTESIGAVPISKLVGEARCNAMMKAETKAKRRATLDLLGLGITDESEVGSIPWAQVASFEPKAPVATISATEAPSSRPASQPPSTQPQQSKAPITPNGGAKQANVEPKSQNPALAGALKAQIEKLTQALGKKAEYAVGYLQSFTADGSDAGAALMPNEGLDALSEHSVQLLRDDWKGFLARLDSYIEDQGGLGPAVDATSDQGKVVEQAAQGTDPNSPDAPWRSFPVPFGKMAGKKLADIEKKYLFGFWANFVVETEYQGKPKKPETIAKDTAFREMLDQAGAHYGFVRKD